MTLKSRLLLILIAVGLLPALIIGLITLNTSSEVIKQNNFNQLLSLKEVKRAAVNRYLQTVQDQVDTMAQNPTVVQSIQGFSRSFPEFNTSLFYNDKNTRLQKLNAYYKNEFLPKFKNKNPNASLGLEDLMVDLSDNALALQSAYISENQHPLGEKHQLFNSGSDTLYDVIHAQYHGFYKHYLETFSYYDIFLIDLSGNIVYSVFKELDYATSLKTGPYRSSGLAKVFRKAMEMGVEDKAVFVDFSQYVPSYNAPAGFSASPIYDGDRVVGVLAFQFPIDRLNAIMTEREGLGETGETYLVGRDLLMRSDSYLDPVNHSVEASFRNPELGKVDTKASQAALKGVKHVEIITDYNGNPVLSAYGPLNFEGFDWAILAEIDEAEALAEVKQLQLLSLGVLVLAALVIIFVALYITRLVMKPLGAEPNDMAALALSVSEGDLKSGQSSANTTGAYHSLLVMSERLKDMVSKISQAAYQQASAAEELSSITQQTSYTLDSQKQNIELVATAMNEMTASFHEVSQNTLEAADASKESRKNVSEGSKQVLNSAKEVEVLSSDLHKAKTKVQDLKQYADSIASILESIKGIADQTNLLALNAAIEAARAGDQGRGFAVVADEVRSLAQNTQNATEEIAQMIQTLQQSSDTASDVMDRCVHTMTSVSSRAVTTANDLKVAVTSAERIDDMMTQIASASEEQCAVAEEINQKIVEINSMSLETHESAEQITEASQELARLSTELQDLVAYFRV